MIPGDEEHPDALPTKVGAKGVYHMLRSDTLLPAVVTQVKSNGTVNIDVERDGETFQAVDIKVVDAPDADVEARYFVADPDAKMPAKKEVIASNIENETKKLEELRKKVEKEQADVKREQAELKKAQDALAAAKKP